MERIITGGLHERFTTYWIKTGEIRTYSVEKFINSKELVDCEIFKIKFQLYSVKGVFNHQWNCIYSSHKRFPRLEYNRNRRTAKNAVLRRLGVIR